MRSSTRRRRWNEVVPLDIAELRGSPQVIEMSPAARAGLVWLLMAQWEAAEGDLPADEEFLRTASGLRDAWPDAKRAILPMFTLQGNRLVYEPLRLRWEAATRANYAIVEGARNSRKRKGRLEGGSRVPNASLAAPTSPLSLREDVLGKNEYKSKSSVIRGIERENRASVTLSAELAEKPQHEANAEPSDPNLCEPSQTPETGRIVPLCAHDLELVSRHAEESGAAVDLGEFGPRAPVMFGTLEDFEQAAGVRAPETATGAVLAMSAGWLEDFESSGAGTLAEFEQAFGEDEKQGAEVRRSVHGEHLEAPGASFGGVSTAAAAQVARAGRVAGRRAW